MPSPARRPLHHHTPAPLHRRGPNPWRAPVLALLGVLSVLGLAAANCRSVAPPQDALTDPQELIAAITSATEDVQTVRLKDMRLDYFGDKGRISVKQLILLGSPDRTRIQTYIPGLDGVAGVLACACGQFAYHDRDQNVYYYGPASAENVARVLPVGLTCRDLGSILLGGLPGERLEREAGSPVLVWDTNTGRYALTWPLERGANAGGRISAQVRHGDWRVTQLTVHNASGTLEYTYTARSFEKVEGFTLPTSRRFLVADESEDISLTGDTIQLNPELDEILFQLEAPQGTPLNYVGDQRPPPPPPPEGDLCQHP
ncbi:MAG: DUF4292 domain-containing protein [Myxococcota bacterium]